MKKRGIILFILLSMIFNNSCLANHIHTQVSRYVTVNNEPQLSQINLLSQSIHVRFTQNITTVGEAINYLLRYSGYSLISENKMSQALKSTLSKPLPIVDRELGPISLYDGLSILSGSAFLLVQDPVNREINFKLKPGYQKYVKNHEDI